MKGTLGHLQFNVAEEHLGWYAELFGLLGWETLYAGDGTLGVGDAGVSLWFNAPAKEVANDHDGPGLNHLAFHTAAPPEVDEATAWLRERGAELLYGTPTRRPEYESETEMYYSVMFDSPDGILMEIVYNGPKAE